MQSHPSPFSPGVDGRGRASSPGRTRTLSAATVATRPGWAGISAVRTGAVVEADDDVASRWGPRIVDFTELVSGRVRELAAGPRP